VEGSGARTGKIDVVVPFAGSGDAARRAIALIAPLVATPLVAGATLVDNSRDGAAAGLGAGGVAVLRAARLQGSYYARNQGAANGQAAWLLFVDSDCIPPADLASRYLDPLPAESTGIVAGGVRSAGADSLAGRYAASRGHIDEGFHIEHGPYPAGVTANLLVRRAAFEEVGGFVEDVRSGADVDFCWRVQQRGWKLEHRPDAALEHAHPDEVRRLLSKARRHSAGRAWVNRRWPGALPRPPIARPLLRAPLVAAYWALRGDRERAAFKLIDIRLSLARLSGYYRGDNGAEPGAIASDPGPSR
jgi:mycofactocin glycosyltransferase